MLRIVIQEQRRINDTSLREYDFLQIEIIIKIYYF